MNAPKDKLEDIIAVLPGMKSPTVMPLAQDGWCSVHTQDASRSHSIATGPDI